MEMKDGNKRISRAALRSSWLGEGAGLLLGLLQLPVRNFLAPPFCGLEPCSHRFELLLQFFILLRQLQHAACPLLHSLDAGGNGVCEDAAGARWTYCGSVFLPRMESNENVRSRSAGGIAGRDGDGVREGGRG